MLRNASRMILIETGGSLDPVVAERTQDGFRSKQMLYNLAVMMKKEGKVEEAEAFFIESLNQDASYVPALVRTSPQSTNETAPLPIALPSKPCHFPFLARAFWVPGAPQARAVTS